MKYKNGHVAQNGMDMLPKMEWTCYPKWTTLLFVNDNTMDNTIKQ